MSFTCFAHCVSYCLQFKRNAGVSCLDLNEFNDNYLNILLDKTSKENRSVFLLSDFNVDLLKYDKHAPTNEFLDSLFHMFLPHIIQPTRINTISKALI